MGAREELIEAARALTERGASPFSPKELIREVRAHGSTYKDSTLRTKIVAQLRAGAKDHWGRKYEDFRRVSRGRYVLTENAGGPPVTTTSEPEQPDHPAPTAASSSGRSKDHRSAWYWEGNVQAAIVAHLSVEQWRILRVADTHSREHGIDVQAKRRGKQLSVEVKGYPSAVYTRGAKAGQPKTYNLGSQARAYFSDALLTGLVMRGDDPEGQIVLAFPCFTTYENLATRTVAPLTAAQIEVWFVDEDGTVSTLEPADSTEQPNEQAPLPPPAPNLTDPD